MPKPTRDAAAASLPDVAEVSSLDDARLVGSDRVLAVLKELARHPDGIGLEDLTRVIGSPKPTVHRGLVALRRAGLADQNTRGHYVLGDEFLRMAFAHHEARPEHVRIRPVLEALAERYGETVHYAVLDHREVVYRAKTDPPRGAVRLTSTVGGRNPAHLTAVGKLLLAPRLTTLEAVQDWIGDATLERRTPNSRCTAQALHDDFLAIRERGFAVDDQENEIGVNCLAVPAYLTSPATPSGAVSVSGLTYRMPLASLVAAVGDIRLALGEIGVQR
ncbi:IclR family transcriptional regulator [Actinoplanes rectilineatus]|uniref:IclR family transcriptional regulator n=1 Tax=Actinoplanes rectilineatus TaxID=113571 RepID=UPI0009F8BBFF|nr:IclR family transcriptional regulator [Actinoplanes rectilineatus]